MTIIIITHQVHAASCLRFTIENYMRYSIVFNGDYTIAEQQFPIDLFRFFALENRIA